MARLQHQASSNLWFSEIQHGFCVAKFSNTAVSSLVRQINHGFRMKAYTACSLLDIGGAFDNAWYGLIITNLKKHYPRYLIFLIHSFLTGSFSCNALERIKLLYFNRIRLSLRQHPSHFLWSITIDKALRLELPAGVKIQAFVDDLVLSKTGCNKSVIQRTLQTSCDILVQWEK